MVIEVEVQHQRMNPVGPVLPEELFDGVVVVDMVDVPYLSFCVRLR